MYFFLMLSFFLKAEEDLLVERDERSPSYTLDEEGWKQWKKAWTPDELEDRIEIPPMSLKSIIPKN